MRLSSMACTHVGRRQNNEDAYSAHPELGLFVVADGMGGYEGGEVASQLTVATIVDFFRRNAADADVTWPFALDRGLSYAENLLGVAVRLAHRVVCSQKQGRNSQMGSTVAAMLIDGGHAAMVHVGDSRVYRLRDGVLLQLTRDHSLYAELQAAGGDLPDRASCSFTNVITRALGMDAAEPELHREPLQAGDVFLLCTDGLVDRVDEAALAATLAAHAPGAACPLLVERAYDSGGRDNITVVVVRVDG
jgi:PPM family protein phosphatase